MGFMYRSLKPRDSYFRNWEKLQRLRRPARRFFVGTISAALLISVLAIFSVAFLAFAALIFVVGMIAFFAAALRSALFRCPRCGKRFYQSWTAGFRPWVDECRHCGLSEFAPCDPAVQQWETIDITHSSPS